ncbi:MAG: hypothetical protein AB8B69_12910 [Chitinophagales bacterium]
MKVLHRKTGDLHEAIIELVEDEDWELIEQSNQFIFNWKQEKTKIVHKLRLKIESEILGLIAIEDIPREYRIHIHLIENGNSNKGREKEYDYIAGCLIAHTCDIAFTKEYGGFVSLEPKTKLMSLYKEKYGFKEMGKYLYTELSNSEELIKKYLENDRLQ